VLILMILYPFLSMAGDDHQNNVTWSEPCSFEEINEHESDASFVSEEEDISMLSGDFIFRILFPGPK
jgi:hypothetical protein